jgi:hypothetical protein
MHFFKCFLRQFIIFYAPQKQIRGCVLIPILFLLLAMSDLDQEQVEKMLQDDPADNTDGGLQDAPADNPADNTDVGPPRAAEATATTTETASTGISTDTSGDKSSVGSSSTAGTSHSELPKIYRNIRAAKLASMTVRTLGGCGSDHFKGLGSFADDPRYGKSNCRFSYEKKN